MKWMGTVFLAVGSFLLWQKRVFHERRKITVLKEMAQAISFMAGEIRCSLTPLPKLVRLCRQRYTGDAAEFFLVVERGLNGGISLQKAWEKAVAEVSIPSGGAKDALMGLGAAFLHDEEAVLRHLAETERRLKEELDERRSEQREKEKLWAVFCASGAGLLWLTVI